MAGRGWRSGDPRRDTSVGWVKDLFLNRPPADAPRFYPSSDVPKRYVLLEVPADVAVDDIRFVLNHRMRLHVVRAADATPVIDAARADIPPREAGRADLSVLAYDTGVLEALLDVVRNLTE